MAEKILSCFIDEAGDFGKYDYHSPFYVVAIVLHEQSNSIQKQIDGLDEQLRTLGFPGHSFHVGPLIRRETTYENSFVEDRKKLLNLLLRFTRLLPIHFLSVIVKKSECADIDILESKLTKAIAGEISKHEQYFYSFDKVIIYYDNGQSYLKRILNIIFSTKFSNIEVRNIHPENYRLFQVADLICTMEHVRGKIENNTLSKSEKEFFVNPREFKKLYWFKLEKQRLSSNFYC